MSTIRETALACYGGRIPRGSGAKAQEALDCLIAREQDMFAAIVEAAVGQGVSEDQVVLLLTNLGMHAPEAAAVAAADGGVGDRISSLERTVQEWIDWARGRGYGPGQARPRPRRVR